MKYLILSIISLLTFLSGVLAQPGLSLDLKKPKKFEDKKLASEKTDEKKFTVPRKFIQNTVTHYNYYHNAQIRLDEIVARSKASFKDDYNSLLPFYNYSLDFTAQFKQDLDSIILKSTAGILLHDLRNSWIDNLYLILGQAYYYRNELDSAYVTFQYLNYAFSPKEKDGWDKVIGSNQNEGGNVFSVSTKENQHILHKALTRPPSRNESLIWQIRTYLAKDQLTEAAGLIETLKNDPLFPDRLSTSLKEMQAWWFYKQNIYDSAAIYLEQSLDLAETKQEQARWEYLIAQLYERAGSHALSKTFYARASKHTIDPLLDVYSILNGLKQEGEGNEKDVQRAVDELLKMARKEKYYTYRDIVYYTAATIEEDRNNSEAAKALLLKSIRFSMNNPNQKSISYLALGDMAFSKQEYVEAASFYDSVNAEVISPESMASFTQRKEALDKISVQSLILSRQDSLQRIASLPEDARDEFINKLVKKLRKQLGLKASAVQSGSGSAVGLAGNDKAVNDLFSSADKGEWYFRNANLRTKGYAEFRAKWGDRANSDNWRRSSSSNQQFAGSDNDGSMLPASDIAGGPVEITYESLLAGLPLTPALRDISMDSVEHALFALGEAYQNGLEEYDGAIHSYERLLSSFPSTTHAEQAWFNLYYCYGKKGLTAKQQEAKQMLASRFASGNFAAKVLNPESVRISPDSAKKVAASAAYDEVYNLFIEGRFAEALQQKQMVDGQFGQHYWTPQLLYIEAVYHIRQRDDDKAKSVLQNIINLYPETPLSEKSKNLLSVLNRRKEIEDYLTALDIQRPEEEQLVQDNQMDKPVPAIIKDTLRADSSLTATIPPADTLVAAAEPVLRPIEASKVKAGQIPAQPGRATVNAPAKNNMDSSRLIQAPEQKASVYSNNPAQPYYVAFVMTKVDPVYVSEARNAFNRYNRENSSSKALESSNQSLTDDIKLLVFSSFENATAALEYIEKAKKLAATDIIPWLKSDKYSFIMVSPENLELLKERKDIEEYIRFISGIYPDRF